jgi:hypothetical protein
VLELAELRMVIVSRLSEVEVQREVALLPFIIR